MTEEVKKKKLVRRGKCLRCGMCCGALRNQPPCQHWDAETHNCRIWRTHQPIVCRLWPRHPRYISQHLNCGFKFYDAETGEEITKKQRLRPDGSWEYDIEWLESYEELNEEC